MDETEHRRRVTDVANAAALLVDAVENVEQDEAEVHTPYGQATVLLDKHGADVQLPGGSTVHVRRE